METDRLKIMAVDDNADNLIALRAVLGEIMPKCTLLTAANGAAALELAAVENPDLILLDIVMPGMDGYEVCRRLKSDEKMAAIPVVFLTALRTDHESRVKALKVGAEGFLSKPMDDQELLAQIRVMARIRAAAEGQRDENERLAGLIAARTRELQKNHLSMLNMLEDIREENTARKKSEDRYQKLAQHLETVREDERKRLSRELHDDIGQILTALKIDLLLVHDECVCGEEVKRKMEDMRRLLSEGIQSVHSLCYRLRPGALDDLGLDEALSSLVSDWQARNGVPCVLFVDLDDAVVSDDVKTAVFRMVQEALTNVSRYAQASRVEINLVADEKTLNVSITDNGCGMDAGAIEKPTSFGLMGMRERVEVLGGELHIESAPGKGVQIEASVSLSGKPVEIF